MRTHDYSFGDLRFDPVTGLLWRGGETVSLGGRAADLLRRLLARRGDIVTKGDLIEAAWGDREIEESNLSVQIAALRRVVGAGRIHTVERVGYQWIDPEPAPAAVAALTPQRTTMPSVAVSPFTSAPDAVGLAGSLADEVTAALVPFRSLSVVGSEREARFLVSGSVGRRGPGMVATARLVDASNGVLLWARRFDGDDLTMTGAIAAAVESRIHLSEMARQARRLNEGSEAYRLYLKGRAKQLSSEVNDNAEAYCFHSAALELEPDNPMIAAAAADALLHRASSGWRRITAADTAQARELIFRAADAPELDGTALGLLGNTAMTAGEEDLGLALSRRGAEFNPNSPLALASAGCAELWADNLDEAEALLCRATTLDPGDPTIRFALAMRACLALFRGEPELALDLGHRALAIAPALTGGHWSLIEAHDMLGQRDKARRAMERYRRIAPGVTIAQIEAGQPYARPERLNGLIGALRRMGMAER